MTSNVLIPMGIKYKEGYLSGRIKAIDEAKRQGFLENSFKEVQLEWGDMDANRRMSYIQTLPRDPAVYVIGGKKSRAKGMIVGSVQNSYLKQVHAPDTVLIAHKIKKVGNSSITLESFIYSYLQTEQVARGETTLVLFDYEKQTTYKVPDDWRVILESALKAGVISSKL